MADVPAQAQARGRVLAHDLLGPQVPDEALPSRFTEDTAHAAAHLGGDAEGSRPGLGAAARHGNADAFDALSVLEPEEGLGRRSEGPFLLDDALDGGQAERDAGGQGGGGLLGEVLGAGLEATLGESPLIEAAEGPRASRTAGHLLEGPAAQAQDVDASGSLQHSATVEESPTLFKEGSKGHPRLRSRPSPPFTPRG